MKPFLHIEQLIRSSIILSRFFIESSEVCSNTDTTNSSKLFLITFDSGPALYSNKMPSDFNFTTNSVHSMNNWGSSSKFAFVNAVPHNTYGWHTGALDHTIDDNNGYMFFVDVGRKGDYIFIYKINNLFIGLSYEFSAYFANINKMGANIILPNVRLEVRASNQNGDLIATTSTGNLPELKSMTWSKHGVSFIANSSTIVLSMISNTEGGNGNDLAIDDIELRVCSTNNSEWYTIGK